MRYNISKGSDIMSKCPICGAPMSVDSCEYCGYKKESEPQEAKKEYVPKKKAPTSYYKPIEQKNNTQPYPYQDGKVIYSTKSRAVTGLLCLFLGVLGVHRFYTGKIFTGIIYLCTFGLFGIGVFIDLVLIITGHFSDKHGFKLR